MLRLIRILKAHSGYKRGQIIEVDEIRAEAKVQAKLASYELHEEKKEEGEIIGNSINEEHEDLSR